MARVAVEIPKVGLVMETGKVVRWLKALDDTVALGEPLVEIETEKAIVEIEASASGRLVEILAQPDEEVSVGAAIAWLEDGVEPAAPKAPRASPAARRLAAERSVDLSKVEGSGPGGRIQLEDIERAAGAPARQPLSPMRRAMARAMALSNATVPQFNVSQAVDWTQAQRARTSPQSLNDFLIQAAARAMIEFPVLNAIFVGDPQSPDAHIEPAGGAHIGLVVALPDGMLVPVLHDAERLSLAEIASLRADLVERARAGRLRKEEASGATLTISNLGSQGPDRFTALLNPPEAAILAVGRARDIPVVRDGAVTVRPVSELCLTVDHRLADGQSAARFLARLVEILENVS